jgi:hypothetical protein
MKNMKIALLDHMRLSWCVCYEFVRQTGRGFVLTFGPLPATAARTQKDFASQQYEHVFENAGSELEMSI